MPTHIVFIGGGNMALAMVGGLLQAGHPANAITLSDPSEERRALGAQLGVATHSDNEAAVAKADVLVLAVKPHLIAPVCLDLASVVARRAPLVVSVAASITLTAIADSLGGHQRIVRVMPNTPALVRCGVSGLYAQANLAQDDRDTVTQILGSVGRTVWLDHEDGLHDVTAISGSGPAYFFLFMEYLEREAMALGLDPDAAALLVRDTAAGAAKMAQTADVPLAELRDRVTSPGGTTAAAIGALIDNHLDDVVGSAVEAARGRSVELAQPDNE